MSVGRACAVCATPCRAPFRVPTAEMAPDLDGRPGEPARSTLPRWVMQCAGCGAAAPDLAALPESAAAIVRAPGYAAERDPFLRWALLCEGLGDRAGAAEAALQAAWAAEDAGREAGALRLRAAEGQDDPLRRLDILRRAGALEQAGAQARSLAASTAGAGDEEAGRIVAFEQDRITAGDTGRHSIASALRPPARSPHVTHGKAANAQGGGLLSRLFRR